MTTELLKNKKCLITGGTRGLGLAIAKEFVCQGVKDIAITYSKNENDAENAARLLREMGVEPLLFKGSVANVQHAQATVKEISVKWGGIDVLVNNAGSMQVLPLALIDENDWDQVMDINCKGVFFFSQSVLRSMIKNKSGAILNVGTFSSERVIESPPHYAAAKAALRGLTESMAKEVGKYNIRVNLLAPGILNEGLGKMIPKHRVQEYIENCALERVGTVDEVAKMAAFLVSDHASFISGAKLTVDGGL